MGWYGTPNASKQDIIDEILDDLKEKTREHKITREGGETVLWVVVAGENYQYILCYLIQYSRGTDPCWGYKPMDESVGPCYYSVPKAWLDKYPCITPDGHTGGSKEWRELVRAAV